MKATFLVLAVVFINSPNWSQEDSTTPVEIAKEPHHTLLLQNPAVRVFRLKLQPEEVTLPHRHKSFYAFISLRPARIGNEVRGRQPVVTEMAAGELRTSKGGFTLAERNISTEPAEITVIEVVKSDGESGFSTPVGDFPMHDAGIVELFETPVVRGYKLAIAADGRTGKHHEDYDRLLMALSDLKVRQEVNGQPASDLEMKAGDVRWVPRGATDATINVGGAPAALLTLEFR